ncbi:MAG: hypothetical protein QOI63_1808, partial [Thermoplasmata archaeon]|nr:hypothetical protein [Thermoplasmata archaeon]
AAPYAGLALVLKQVPDAATSFQPMPWSHAAGHALVLLGLMGLHAACYARWSRGAPRRIAANELLTRLWFVAFGFLVVAAHPHGPGGLFLAAGLAWAGLSWLTHLALARRQGGYRAISNVALLGLFLLGLALLGLVALGNLVLARGG